MGRLVIDFIAWDTVAWYKLPSQAVAQVVEGRLESEELQSADQVAMFLQLVLAFSCYSCIEPADCSIGCSTERAGKTDLASESIPGDTSSPSAGHIRMHIAQLLSSPRRIIQVKDRFIFKVYRPLIFREIDIQGEAHKLLQSDSTQTIDHIQKCFRRKFQCSRRPSYWTTLFFYRWRR